MNVEELVCQICDTDVIEDEIHFLMSCNVHQQERYKLLLVAEHRKFYETIISSRINASNYFVGDR